MTSAPVSAGAAASAAAAASLTKAPGLKPFLAMLRNAVSFNARAMKNDKVFCLFLAGPPPTHQPHTLYCSHLHSDITYLIDLINLLEALSTFS